MSGRLTVIGLGPGDARYLTPEANEALAAADALYGYDRYLDRVPVLRSQTRHSSDNREEGARALAALRHAAEGGNVAVVSGGCRSFRSIATVAFIRGETCAGDVV